MRVLIYDIFLLTQRCKINNKCDLNSREIKIFSDFAFFLRGNEKKKIGNDIYLDPCLDLLKHRMLPEGITIFKKVASNEKKDEKILHAVSCSLKLSAKLIKHKNIKNLNDLFCKTFLHS